MFLGCFYLFYNPNEIRLSWFYCCCCGFLHHSTCTARIQQSIAYTRYFVMDINTRNMRDSSRKEENVIINYKSTKKVVSKTNIFSARSEFVLKVIIRMRKESRSVFCSSVIAFFFHFSFFCFFL